MNEMLNQYEDPNTWAQLMAGAAMMERGGPSYEPVSIGQTMSHGIKAAAGMYDMALRGQMAQKKLQLESDQIAMYDKRYSEQHQFLQDKLKQDAADREAERKKDIEVARIMAARGKEKDPMMEKMLKAQEQGRLFQRFALEERDPRVRAAMEKFMPYVMSGVYDADEAKKYVYNEVLGHKSEGPKQPSWWGAAYDAGKGQIGSVFSGGSSPSQPSVSIGGNDPASAAGRQVADKVSTGLSEAASYGRDVLDKPWSQMPRPAMFGQEIRFPLFGNKAEFSDYGPPAFNRKLPAEFEHEGKRFRLTDKTTSDGKRIAETDDGTRVLVDRSGALLPYR